MNEVEKCFEMKEFCYKLIELKKHDPHKFYELKRIMEELLNEKVQH